MRITPHENQYSALKTYLWIKFVGDSKFACAYETSVVCISYVYSLSFACAYEIYMQAL